MKLSPIDLNSGPFPPHLTSTYICGVTIALKMCGVYLIRLFMKKKEIEEPRTN